MRTERQTDDMTELIVAFRNFAKAPKDFYAQCVTEYLEILTVRNTYE
jgi:hypothetical protein